VKTPSAKNLWNLRSCGKTIDKKIQSAISLYNNFFRGNGASEDKLVSCLESIDEFSKALIWGCRNSRLYKVQEFKTQYGKFIQTLQEVNILAASLGSKECSNKVAEAAQTLYDLTIDWEGRPVPELPVEKTPLEEEKPNPKNTSYKLPKISRIVTKKATYESGSNQYKRFKVSKTPKTPEVKPGSRMTYRISNAELETYLKRRCGELDRLVSKLSGYTSGSGKKPHGLKLAVKGIHGISNNMLAEICRKGGTDKYKLLDTFGDSISAAYGILKKLSGKFPEVKAEARSLKAIEKQWRLQYQLSKPLSKSTLYQAPFTS
jgi:hypothetical protein